MSHSYIPRTDVYRPYYGTVRPQTPAPATVDNSLNDDDRDVNRIPLNLHRRNTTGPAQFLQLWDDHLDPLMHRTVRAYDLVISYHRDSNGGIRWSRKDINHIHRIGSYLHGDVRALKHWKEVIAKEGEQDPSTMNKIYEDAENMRKYCEQIQDVIKETERVPLRQRMNRDARVQADEKMEQDREESEYGQYDLDRLDGNATEDDGLEIEMFTNLENEAGRIDPVDNARQADWATRPSTRFAW